MVDAICECLRLNPFVIPQESISKHRYRTQAKTAKIRSNILSTFTEIKRVMTVRQVYYRLVIRGIVDKTDGGYDKVQVQLKNMRQEGLVPYSLVSDPSRSWYQLDSHNSLENAVTGWLHNYRLDIWKDLDCHVEIWLEKEALSGIFREVTYEFDVPLFVAKGFTSESFAYTAAEHIKQIGKPTFIYIFSDHDPSGHDLSDTIIKKIRSFGVDPHFERAALTEEQVREYNLPTRYTKESTHSRSFNGESTELDALHPDILLSLIKDCIYRHISPHDIRNIKMEEAVHKETLRNNILGHT